MERGWLHGEGFLLCLILHLLLQGRGDNFTINCSGFDQHGVDPAAFQAVFDRKAFRPVTNFSIPTHVHISFTLSANLEVDAHLQLMTSFLWLNVMWYNPFLRWNPVECGGIRKLSVAAENLWLPDIFIEEFMDMADVSSDDHIEYSKPMQVTSICNLDIVYFPFDEQNCTLTSSAFIYTVQNMVLGMEQDVQEILKTSQNVVWSKGERVLQGIHQRMMKMTVGTSEYDQIIFYVTIRRRRSLWPRVISLLVPSSFLIAIDALSFYLPAESESYAPFKMTLLMGYNVFLLMTLNDLLPASGSPLISVYLALCLSLMVVSLLETIFITYLLHLATTQPPPRPRWLRSLLLHCTSPRKHCPAAPQKGNTGLGLSPAHLPGEGNQHCPREPVELVGKVPGPREAELNGCPGSARAQQEDEAQKQHSVSLWLQLSHMTDTLLFRLCLLFPAPSVVTVIILWDT
ncbi:LOW QUALITY PROTEIN: 5-hydroxytryptamine receptor 3C-like [Eschrichtius robustus]|uniref:LOW QUALITY PROTEIN: 5-hydroxytryptamine receptor 3C-like n=1 Tax=Eschrichtius robustus TaxID=9764 RepID=UPI0035C2403D